MVVKTIYRIKVLTKLSSEGRRPPLGQPTSVRAAPAGGDWSQTRIPPPARIKASPKAASSVESASVKASCDDDVGVVVGVVGTTVVVVVMPPTVVVVVGTVVVDDEVAASRRQPWRYDFKALLTVYFLRSRQFVEGETRPKSTPISAFCKRRRRTAPTVTSKPPWAI